MTFEKILDGLSFNTITLKEAYNALKEKDKLKTINYFIHRNRISKDPLKDGELSQLTALVNILQILYTSDIGSPISDESYDILQEMLIDQGIPRLSGSLEINLSKKVDHKYMNLRGTLSKIYYLRSDEKRTNSSRKYLDEWIKSTESRYEKITGKPINLRDIKVIITPKFDGTSVVAEVSPTKKGFKVTWLTRGDTEKNKASDVSHIMNIFDSYILNDLPALESGGGIKFECMVTEENMKRINDLSRSQQYKNSRQIVTATLNSNDADYKADYLYPVGLRYLIPDDEIEEMHPDLLNKFPHLICKLGDVDKIKKFADENKWVYVNNMRFRTDGAVITIIDKGIQKILGRDNNINNFETAYKFTEEFAYTKVRDVEFYVSEMGFITPVLVVNPVILKGNTIDHISLSNKERFDELFFSRGDDVKVLYDIIPYATRDERCQRVKKGRKIEFINHCPKCRSELDLDVTQVQCKNPNCPARIIGRILNYCNNLRIQNIGYQTLDTLYAVGLLNKGIRSLYKLKKKTDEIQDLDGFGKLKTKKIIREIESKRRLKDYEFFGSIGIETLSMKTFQSIFSHIKYQEFMDMIKVKNFNMMISKLITIDGIGEKKGEVLITYLKDTKNRIEIEKLLEEISIQETYGDISVSKGKIVFSGFRDEELRTFLESKGYEVSDTWTNKTSYLVVKDKNESTTKMDKAEKLGIPILTIEEAMENIGRNL